jgi:hypothetical protein
VPRKPGHAASLLSPARANSVSPRRIALDAITHQSNKVTR